MPRPRMFTEAEVIAMREQFASGMTLKEIARGRVGLGPLHMIVTGRTYVEVGGPVAQPGIRLSALLRKRARLARDLREIDRRIVIGGGA